MIDAVMVIEQFLQELEPQDARAVRFDIAAVYIAGLMHTGTNSAIRRPGRGRPTQGHGHEPRRSQ